MMDLIKIIEGQKGAEGPVFDLENNLFMVNSNSVLHVIEDDFVDEVITTGGTPAGLQVDQENNLWCADMELGILMIKNSENKMSLIVSAKSDGPVKGCNDCVFDSHGNLYFTSPEGSGIENPVGKVFCLKNNGDLVEIDTGYRFSNGIAISKDDSKLFVAETFTKRIWRYTLKAPGVVISKKLWAKLPGKHYGGPDGMDFDCQGYLLVANWGGGSIDVFNFSGKLVERIYTPFRKPSNLHFKLNPSKWVFVTEHTNGGLWKFKWKREGQIQYCER